MENPPPKYRVYRQKWWVTSFSISFSTFAFLLGIFFLRGPWSAGAKVLELAVAVCMLIVGIVVTLNSFKAAVTFTENAIEVNTIVGKKRLPLSAIRGRREYVDNYGEGGSRRYLKLVPKDDRLPTLEFEKYYALDDEFYRWFNQLPDLDAADKKVHKDSNFGLV